ncbi:hypothetical protein Q5752_001210 [Cryptotrichosporon argae]
MRQATRPMPRPTPARLVVLVVLLALLPSAHGFHPYAACRVVCNAAFLSCMNVYANVAICSVAVRQCFARC